MYERVGEGRNNINHKNASTLGRDRESDQFHH